MATKWQRNFVAIDSKGIYMGNTQVTPKSSLIWMFVPADLKDEFLLEYQ